MMRPWRESIYTKFTPLDQLCRYFEVYLGERETGCMCLKYWLNRAISGGIWKLSFWFSKPTRSTTPASLHFLTFDC